MGVILGNSLRHKSEALSEAQWLPSAFRQHCGCLFNLAEVGWHGSDAVACISKNSSRFIRRRLSFDKLIPLSPAFAFEGANVEPPGSCSSFVFSAYFNGYGERDLATTNSGARRFNAKASHSANDPHN